MSQTILETPTDLLRFQLRTAVTMEEDSLAALGELASAAQSSDVKKLFRHHADETREQMENLSSVFTLLELPESSAASPSTKGISKQAASLIARSSANLRDQVTLASALGNEHYEISAYEALIIAVQAMGNGEVLALLKENLDQETHTSEELRARLQAMQ
jgi:ferritin-like metal-binding protein YciE